MSVIRKILNSTKALVNNSLPTTGSNTFVGTQTYSGSIIPATNNTYDLGSETKQFRHLYLSSGSLYIDGQKVLGSTGNELQITTDNGQSIKILEAGSDNIILQSADGNIELKTSGGGDVILDPTNGVIGIKGTMTIYSGNKILSSDGNAIQFGNDLVITGSITTTGNVNGVNLSTFSSSLDTRIITEKNRVDAILTASSADKDSFVEIVSLINSVDTSNDSTFASFYTASVGRLNNLETTSASVNISVSNLNTFSGSALTRLSTLEVETANLESFTSSINTTIKTRLNAETVVSSSSQVVGILSSLNTYTGSNDTTNTAQNSRLTSIESVTGSYETRGRGIVSGSSQITLSSTTGYGSVLNQAVLTTSSPTFAGVTITNKLGIGTGNVTATKLSLGTGIGAKLMVYDNGSGVYSGIGQDMAEGNSTDLFAHGSGNLGFITFGKLGTNGTTYTEWARFDTAGNLNIKGGQIQQNGTGIIQMVPIGPTATNIAYTATINGQYTIGSASIPAAARWLLADIFITANISDHQNFMMTRFNFGTQKNWVDTRGNNPASEFGNLTQGDVALLTYNGEQDGYTPNYGVWKSSVMVPSVGRTLWINNHGNSNSNGYLYFIVRAYSL
jgi:hypothetical protein